MHCHNIVIRYPDSFSSQPFPKLHHDVIDVLYFILAVKKKLHFSLSEGQSNRRANVDQMVSPPTINQAATSTMVMALDTQRIPGEWSTVPIRIVAMMNPVLGNMQLHQTSEKCSER